MVLRRLLGVSLLVYVMRKLRVEASKRTHYCILRTDVTKVQNVESRLPALKPIGLAHLASACLCFERLSSLEPRIASGANGRAGEFRQSGEDVGIGIVLRVEVQPTHWP